MGGNMNSECLIDSHGRKHIMLCSPSKLVNPLILTHDEAIELRNSLNYELEKRSMLRVEGGVNTAMLETEIYG